MGGGRKMKSSKLKAQILSAFCCLYSVLSWAQADSDAVRQKLILDALNSVPAEWIAPITEADIHIKNGVGRIDVNKSAKFSYYINTENPSDPSSLITLIPMATSRYTPTYYQTDEWWDAHKAEIDAAKAEGKPMPRQDMAEVETWLKKMKLSTNPIVMEVKPGQHPKVVRLQAYLLDYYIKNYARNGKITLYRGGEKPTETAEWLAGRKPRGVRYWTPTATYAWRYARKNSSFLTDLVNGHPPLYVFELGVDQFKALVQRSWQRLTLGTELTKRVQDNFDRTGTFTDHLLGQSEYMGIGDLGVEFEIRSNSQGAKEMLFYFKRTIGIEELVADRVRLLDKTLARLLKANSAEADKLQLQYESRKSQAVLEGKILLAIQLKMSRKTLETLAAEYGSRAFSEIANVDSVSFESFIQSEISALPHSPGALTEELRRLDQKLGGGSGMCDFVFAK
jgi:hypothetical protein